LSIGLFGEFAFRQLESFATFELVAQEFKAPCNVSYPCLLSVKRQSQFFQRFCRFL
jgi:hypothetical protein